MLTALRQEPYRQLVDDITFSGVKLVDDTDVNCDVCFRYVIGSEGLLFLRLSMVGPYAILERAHVNDNPELIVREEDCSSRLEDHIFHMLVRYGVQLMSDTQLTDNIEMRLPNIKRPTVYNALFSPEEETNTEV